MRCGADVDLRDRCFPGGRNCSLVANSVAAEGGNFGMNYAVQSLIMVISYWGYVALLPAILVAFVVRGWLIRPKE